MEDIQVEDRYSGIANPPCTTTTDESLPTSAQSSLNFTLAQDPPITSQSQQQQPDHRPSAVSPVTFSDLTSTSTSMTQPAATMPISTSASSEIGSFSTVGQSSMGTLSGRDPLSQPVAANTVTPVITCLPNVPSNMPLAAATTGIHSALAQANLRPPQSSVTQTQVQPPLSHAIGTFPVLHSSLHPQIPLSLPSLPIVSSHNPALQGLPNTEGGTQPPNITSASLQNLLNPQHGSGATNMSNLQMPLTHPLPTSLAPPIAHPLLPAMPSVYSYPYGSIQGVQTLPSQPSTTAVRTNAPSFPGQALMSGYPPYVPPSLYGNQPPPVSTRNFSTR